MADHDGNDITKRAGPEMSLLATLLLYSRHMIALHRKITLPFSYLVVLVSCVAVTVSLYASSFVATHLLSIESNIGASRFSAILP